MSSPRLDGVTIKTEADYSAYLKSRSVPVTAEGQELINDVTLSLDQPGVKYNIRDLPDDEKAKAIAAIMSNDTQGMVDTIGPYIRVYDVSDEARQLMNAPGFANEWVNPLAKQIIKLMLADNGAELESEPIPLPKDRIANIIQKAATYAENNHLHLTDDAINSFSNAVTKSPADAYVEYLNRDLQHYNALQSDVVSQIRINIEHALDDADSPLAKYFESMPENSKIQLMSALISNDHVNVAKYLADAPIPGASKDQVGNIAYFNAGEEASFMNSTTRKITQQLLNQDGRPLGIESAHKIITNAMSQIHDTEIDLRTKLSIAKTIDPDVKTLFVGYNEYVKPLQSAKSNGYVSLNEYNKAIANSSVDYSQFIILSMGVLEAAAKADPALAQAINSARNDYMNTKYESAIDTLKSACHQVVVEGGPAAKAAQSILANAEKLNPATSEVDITKNYSRRFLENRVSALYFGNANNFESINKVGRYFGHGDFHDVTDTASAIRELTSLPEQANEAAMARKVELTSLYTGDYKKKGRELKDDFYAQENEPSLDPGKRVDSLFSQNLGVMKSYQPNYRDELADKSIRNPQPDVNTFVNSKEYYPLQNNRSAYVASISGHTYMMVAMLEQYMQNNPGNDLNRDMNEFLRGYVATYVGRGYHSYLECVHVLQEPAVKELFAKHGVTLEPNLPEHTLIEAFKDTQSYTKTTVLAEAARNEMKAGMKKLISAVNRGDSRTVQSMIKSSADIRDMCKQNHDALVQMATATGNPIIIAAMKNPDQVAPAASKPIKQTYDSGAIEAVRSDVQSVLEHDSIMSRMRGLADEEKIEAIAAILAHDPAGVVDKLGARIGLYEVKDAELLMATLESDPKRLINPVCNQVVDMLLSKNDEHGNAVKLTADEAGKLLNKSMDAAQMKNANISSREREVFVATKLNRNGADKEDVNSLQNSNTSIHRGFGG